MKKLCKNCNVSFSTENSNSKFCSISCYSLYRKNNKNLYESYYFRKGSVPWNKDKKGIHLSPFSEFKPGESNKRLPIFSIRPRKDKNGSYRQYIKIQDNRWIFYSVWLWENKYGSVPKGFVVHHVNFNKSDDRLENLTVLSRKDHINLHRVQR